MYKILFKLLRKYFPSFHEKVIRDMYAKLDKKIDKEGLDGMELQRYEIVRDELIIIESDLEQNE